MGDAVTVPQASSVNTLASIDVDVGPLPPLLKARRKNKSQPSYTLEPCTTHVAAPAMCLYSMQHFVSHVSWSSPCYVPTLHVTLSVA